MDKCLVGIFRSNSLNYSSEWVFKDDYPEVHSLRFILNNIGHDEGNMFHRNIKNGNKVVIKPNWVIDTHSQGRDVFSIVTHSAIIRSVVDLVYEAMKGEGSIVIADAPQWDCDFENLLRVTQVERISEYYWSKHRFEIQVRDLREVCCATRDGFIRSADRVKLAGDPEGYSVVALGRESAFGGMPGVERIYGADYDRTETIRHHCSERHEYRVSRTVLGADVLISVPKLKVHKKVGVTMNAKGMVGINGNKNWVAHYRIGSPAQGGDEYPDAEPDTAKKKARAIRLLIDRLLAPQSQVGETAFRWIHRSYQKVKPLLGTALDSRLSVDAGNWYGNDTAWRMTADLVRIALFADREGRIHDKAQRRFLSVVDGIIGGEEEGPLSPSPKPCGVLIAGENPLAVDLVGARLMGFDWKKIKYLRWLVEQSPQSIGVRDPEKDIEITSNVAEWRDLMQNPSALDLGFVPHPGWIGQIELDRSQGKKGAGV